MAAQLPPAGWYPDPDDAALQRYWDGGQWTGDRTPATPAPAASTGGLAETAERTGDMPPPAAWYADPENPQGMRYWDGTRWTEDRTDYRAAPAPARKNDGLVAAGYIFSLLIPIVGVVLGAILLGRKDRNGPWILGLSIFFIAAFVLIGALGADN